MTKTLSDTQRAILTAAASADDRVVHPQHVPLKGGAVRVVLLSLVRKGLLEEIEAAAGAHVWWDDGEQPVALKVTVAGCEAVGVTVSPRGSSPKTFRAGTKQATLIGMLQRPEGATIEEMAAATGWLTHTVRGALAGAIKKRLRMEVTSEKVEGRGRVYRVRG
ncbi:DUF3489 domain-containing protein [Hansschlegelia sp.]|uniref:DUF3489 domain-containing protein n=1 Tax=Hansschlegelia sp. TaxID=2041892 RepID=UPI002BA27BC6|nr:DUF3489 domain-containing protein [Hansschlegelia sp.]HVI27288.1 DUF3489 domain-containing protein [Hansschlegelia sp.]